MKIAELIRTPDRWCKNKMATDASGFGVGEGDERATRWCVLGAYMKCHRVGRSYSEIGERASRFIPEEHLDRTHFGGFPSSRGWTRIITYNNHPDTTHEDIMVLARALDEEVALADKEAQG